MKARQWNPALCQWPLIEAIRREAKTAMPQAKQNFAGFLTRLLAKVGRAIASRVPAGFEDDRGFHYGTQKAPGSVIFVRCRTIHTLATPTLKAHWTVKTATHFNLDAHPVLQWDSSSRPPCRLSSKFISTKIVLRRLAKAATDLAAESQKTAPSRHSRLPQGSTICRRQNPHRRFHP